MSKKSTPPNVAPINDDPFQAASMPIVEDDPILNVNLPRPRFRILTANDALQRLPPVRCAIENIAPFGSVIIFYGESGSLKTYSLIDAGISVAGDEKQWLGLKLNQCPVLIVDEEAGEFPILRRLGDALRGHNAGQSTPIFCLSFAGFDFSKADDLEYLRQFIVTGQFGLVIIDALSDVAPGMDENSVKEMKPIFLGLRRIAQETGAAIVLIHHKNKSNSPNDYRGSSTIKADVDVMVKVVHDKGTIKFETVKVRDGAPVQFLATPQFDNLDPDNKKFWLEKKQGPIKPVSTNTYNKAERFVLLYLFNHGESASKDIIDSIDPSAGDPAPKSVKNAMSKFQSSGLIERTDNGRVGQAGTYQLTALGNQEAENL